MAAKKRAKKRKEDDDDDYEDDEDEYTALSKSLRKSKSNNAKPSIGSLDKCAKCSKQFTVVRSLVVCGEHPINYDLRRLNIRWLLTLHLAIFATPAPRHPELTHSRSRWPLASASRLLKSGVT
jgi:hypothetical protein